MTSCLECRTARLKRMICWRIYIPKFTSRISLMVVMDLTILAIAQIPDQVCFSSKSCCLLIDLLSRLSCLHVILKNGVMCILSIVKTGRFFPFSDSSGLVQGQNPQLRQLSQNFYCFYIKKKVICASS